MGSWDHPHHNFTDTALPAFAFAHSRYLFLVSSTYLVPARRLHIQPSPPPSLTFLVLLFSPLSPLSSTPYCFLIPPSSTLPPVSSISPTHPLAFGSALTDRLLTNPLSTFFYLKELSQHVVRKLPRHRLYYRLASSLFSLVARHPPSFHRS
jgi:hypothetical protein